MQCAKMQGSTNAAIGLDPSTFRLANALQLTANASPALLLISGESSIKESRQEDRRNKSSWIRRLKSQDETELSKGGVAEASLETTNSEKGDSCERMHVDSGSLHPVRYPQDKATNDVRGKPNWQAESVSDAKRKQKDCDGDEKQRSVCLEKALMIEPGKSMASTAIAPPSNVGFGPWVNLNSVRKQGMKPESGLGSKNVVGTVTTSTQGLSKDAQGDFRSAFSLTNSMLRCSPVSMEGDVTAPAIFYNRPLSPIHSKLGLPPRPPNQKTPGFHPPFKVAPTASVGFNQFARDVQPNRQLFDTPSHRDNKQFVGVQDKDASELGGAAIGRSESFFQKLKPSEQSFSGSIRDNGKCLTDCGQQLCASSYTRMGNNSLPIRQVRPSVAERASPYVAIGQPIGSCSDGVAVLFENGRRGLHEDLHTNMYREGAREPICTNLPSDGVDFHLKVSGPGMEDSKAASKNESRLQTASTEPNKTPLQQSPSGSSHGASTSSKADASASTSASLPWEMFIEPAGASRKAREQFVEVYNRARDELKNQRMSQTTSRASAREMDGDPKLTLGPGKHEQHLAGHSQAQGRLNVSSTNPEHRALSRVSSLKEQHSISLVESKGPVTTLANEQSGLHGVSLKSDTPWKQADSFRREQTLPEGQPRWSQSLDERSVAHSKESRPGNKGQLFSSTSTANTASKLDEGNGSRLSHQFDDRKESTPAFGKRSRVTFEKHSISRVAEKGAVSRARSQSSPHVWLQRWHPTAVSNSKGLPEAQVPSDGKRSDSVSCLALGLKKFKDGDAVGVFG